MPRGSTCKRQAKEAMRAVGNEEAGAARKWRDVLRVGPLELRVCEAGTRAVRYGASDAATDQSSRLRAQRRPPRACDTSTPNVAEKERNGVSTSVWATMCVELFQQISAAVA